MSTSPVDPYEVIRRLVIENAGGYLRNVVWAPPTCTYCAGVPNSSGFTTCIPCESYLRRLGQLSDQRGFITYALAGAQSGSNMYRYKDPVPPPAATRMMQLLLAATLTKHLRCASSSQLGPVTAWTAVPSLSGRQDHPLPGLAAPFLRATPWVSLVAAPDARHDRSLRPANYLVTGAGFDPTGQHVLLLDDTWVTGSNAESAAASLKSFGARAVTSLVVARWLDKRWGDTLTFIQSSLTQDFDPAICPFTGNAC